MFHRDGRYELYVCMYVCMYVFVLTETTITGHTHIHHNTYSRVEYVYVCVCMYVCMYVCMPIREDCSWSNKTGMPVCQHLRTEDHSSLYVCMYVCMYVCVYGMYYTCAPWVVLTQRVSHGRRGGMMAAMVSGSRKAGREGRRQQDGRWWMGSTAIHHEGGWVGGWVRLLGLGLG